MREMDEYYLHHPFKGTRRRHVWLTKDKGYKVSKNRVKRLYFNVMGLRAIMSGKYTSRRNKDHKVYPPLRVICKNIRLRLRRICNAAGLTWVFQKHHIYTNQEPSPSSIQHYY